MSSIAIFCWLALLSPVYSLKLLALGETKDEGKASSQNAAAQTPLAPKTGGQTPVVPPGATGRNTGRSRFNERQQRLEEELRRAMTNLGCTDVVVQNEVLAYIREETRARRPLVEQSRRLFFLLRASTPEFSAPEAPATEAVPEMMQDETEGVESPNRKQAPAQDKTANNNAPNNTGATTGDIKKTEQRGAREKPLAETRDLAAQVTAYRAALEADRLRHKAAEAALDSKIKFSQNPRLEAMLLLMGVIGETPNLPLRLGAIGGSPRPNPPRNPPPNLPNVPGVQNMPGARNLPGGPRNNPPQDALPPSPFIPNSLLENDLAAPAQPI